ncbi:MAG: sulfite exporter TauE/SafE family protein [Acidobacteriota bacterium]|nr:sulfite exporter TauE/SafE family protein [Acidobacteriota bacterium]
MSIAVLVLVGFAAGVMSGMFGIGGGIVIVPALVLLAGFSLVEATGTSLAAILLPVGLLGVIAYYKARIIDIRAAAWMAAGLMISVAAGAWLANALPADTMRIIYAVFLLYMSWEFIEPRRRVLRALGKDAPAKPEPETAPRAPAPALVGVGLAAGVMSGLFGIGGGNIIVPFLTIFLGYPAKRAIATSLATILLPMRLPGVLVFWREGTLDLAAAVPVALGIFLGTVFGARITIRLPSATVKLLYGLFLLFMAARFFF